MSSNSSSLFLLWQPHGAHPARIAVGRGRGACGIVREVRKNFARTAVLEVAADGPNSPIEMHLVSAWRLGPISFADRAHLPAQPRYPVAARPRIFGETQHQPTAVPAASAA